MVNYPFVILSLLLLCGVVSANSDYCTPFPNDITTTVVHEGDWFNITFTSPSCYVCVDDVGGYGTVTCELCSDTVGFTANKTCGIVPFAVQFNDTSSGTITDYYWDFVNENSTLENPVIEYTVPGVYGVDHSITIGDNVQWLNKTNYITARAVGDTCNTTTGYVVGSGGGITRDADSIWFIYGGIGALALIFMIILFIYLK